MNPRLSGGDFEPFYFGPPDKRLYGCYHAAQAGPRESRAVVLCSPLGHEYIRSHRAFRQLAIRLARAGFHVLRFDYTACGDSAGADDAGQIAQWLIDIATAVDELKRRCRPSQVYLAGLRLGASLATLHAAGRSDAAGLVLWEPVVDGAAYLSELSELHQEVLWRFFSKPEQDARDQPKELLGFPLTDTLRGGIEHIHLLSVERKPAPRILIVEREAQAATAQLKEHLTGLGAELQHQSIGDPKIWTEDPDKALVPHPTLQAIVAWLSEVGA